MSLVVNLSGFWKAAGRRDAYEGITSQRQNQFRQRLQESQNDYRQIDQELKLINSQKSLLQERIDVSIRSRDVSKAKMRLGRISFLELQQTEESVFNAGQDQALALNRERELRLQKEMALVFTSDHPRRDQACPFNR